jgi:inosose dehydratase
MTVRFGVSPIAWSNDDMPELGGDTPVETILADAAEIGFSGIELGNRFPRQAGELAPLLARHRLDLIGGWYSTHLLTRSVGAEIAALQPHLALLRSMGSPVFIAAECSNAIHGDRERSLAETPLLQPQEWSRFGERMSVLAAHVEAEGLKFAYHFHLGTIVQGPNDLDRFIAHTADNVGLVIDTGHADLAGIDPEALIRRHPHRVSHVHAKDVRRSVFQRVIGNGESFLDGVLGGMFTAPGDGDLNFGPVMRSLADIGYVGWVVVEAEQDPKRADPRVYSSLGLQTLRSEAARRGVGI